MSNYVPVNVPEEYLPEVLRYLASLLSQTPGALANGEAAPRVARDGAWPEELMRAVYLDVTDDARTVLVSLAERSKERVAVPTLAALLDKDEAAVRGALSSLSKRMKQHGGAHWPFAVHEDRSGRYSYEMNDVTAAVVLKVRDWFEGIIGAASSSG